MRLRSPFWDVNTACQFAAYALNHYGTSFLQEFNDINQVALNSIEQPSFAWLLLPGCCKHLHFWLSKSLTKYVQCMHSVCLLFKGLETRIFILLYYISLFFSLMGNAKWITSKFIYIYSKSRIQIVAHLLDFDVSKSRTKEYCRTGFHKLWVATYLVGCNLFLVVCKTEAWTGKVNYFCFVDF